MANSRQKIFHLEMEGEHYYFGSPKAIFDVMGPERMGMKYTSFHSNITLKPGDVYKSRRRGWIIRVGLLEQAKTNRGVRRNLQEVTDVLLEAKTEPTAEPIVEPIVEQMSEPIVEPIVEQMSEPVAEPVVEQMPETVAEPVAEPDTTTEQTPEATHAESAPRRSRKKKTNDVPEQLTLF